MAGETASLAHAWHSSPGARRSPTRRESPCPQSRSALTDALTAIDRDFAILDRLMSPTANAVREARDNGEVLLDEAYAALRAASSSVAADHDIQDC